MVDIVSVLSTTDRSGETSNGGGWYTDLATWESAQQSVHTSGDHSFLKCYDDWPSGLNSTLELDGWSVPAASSTVDVTIYAEANSVTTGLGTGFYWRKPVSSSNNFRGGSLSVELIGLRIECNDANGAISYPNSPTSDYLNYFTNCVLVRPVAGRMFRYTFDKSLRCRNCLFLQQSTADGSSDYVFYKGQSGQSAIFENCTSISYSNTLMFQNQPASILHKNHVVYNNVSAGQAIDQTQAGGTNNATSDTGITNDPAPQTGITSAAFVNFAGLDFNPAPGGPLEGNGADLSVDFTDDLTGAIRTLPWEIGCFEIVSAGGVTFDGPDIVNQTGTQDQPFSFDENGEGTVASRFSVT